MRRKGIVITVMMQLDLLNLSVSKVQGWLREARAYCVQGIPLKGFGGNGWKEPGLAGESARTRFESQSFTDCLACVSLALALPFSEPPRSHFYEEVTSYSKGC